MSIRSELIERLGDHKDHRKDVMAPLTRSMDEYNGPIYQAPPIKFNYRYELRHTRRIAASEIHLDKILTRSMLRKCYDMANQPIQLWSDPDTTDQINRILEEDGLGRLGDVIICTLKQGGRRYKNAGIFFRNLDPQSSLRLVDYLLPFPVDAPDDDMDDIEANID